MGGGRTRVDGWPKWARSRWTRAWIVLVDTGAAAVFLTAPFERGGRYEIVASGVLLGCGVVAAETARRVEGRRLRYENMPYVNLSSVWTMAGALVLPPAVAGALAAALYAHVWLRGPRGMHLARVAFNASNVIVTCQVTAWCAAGLGTYDGSPLGTFGLGVLIVVYFAVNTAIASVLLALDGGDRSARGLLGARPDNVLELATLCAGVLVALMLEWHPPLVALVLLPAFCLHRSGLVRQFERAATIDAKTELLNAARWHEVADAELERARRGGTGLGVLMIDVDHFRQVNNTMGHLAGDEALRAVGRAMRETTDLCGRFGGEEFVVALPATTVEDAADVADRIRRRVERMRVTSSTGAVFGVTVSIGVAGFPTAGQSVEDVMHAADNALFTAKRRGRNRVHVALSGD
ncbi:GGDEF domain-containing protein [Amycolatopsis minnesotensis]|uniref:GGDEF domain-containing protein n=1 Tax=Amycolatopsis minnesotensis TaxID=337894 RepID=UPI0031D88C6F